ncbi:MAG: sulfite exporter TauE/SafE family protein [Bacteroidetes bacterium]|nr:MAG: sulfite exporter TauE/SafE family protein [Bacteroidota bacterium]
MDWIELLGYVAAIATGFVLGAVGSGGSIMALPVLMYVFGIPATEATSYSLFIVGMTAITGTLRAQKKGELHIPVAFKFGLPMMLAVILSRSLILPNIPASFGDFSRDRVLTLLFALIMLGAARALWRGRSDSDGSVRPAWLVIAQGFSTGILTGLVGAGGGFIIVPALVLGLKLPMRFAVGTSLAIIAVNSGFGFAADVVRGFVDINWTLLLTFASLSILGLFVGSRVASSLPQKTTKRAFAVLVAVLALIMLFAG